GLSQIGYDSYYATLARAMIAIGQAEDAARIVDFVLHQGPQQLWLSEFLRLRAATERAFGRDPGAETTLREAFEMADKGGWLPLRLRSAFDFATLLNDRHAPAEARRILSQVYDEFTEGFDTGDLRKARQLLNQLS